MPQYFYLKGYLIDTETNKPLCTAYSSPMYTKEMQEFLAKTTDDFDEDKVLNFDNEKDNNFAVYKENVKLVDDSSDKNKVTKSDDTTKTYVIENIDESISSLKEGDIFSYNYSEGNALVVKVATITIDGTTATITGADTEINEVFDYMKIDSTAKKSDFAYDNTKKSEYLKPQKNETKKKNSRAVSIDGELSNADEFYIEYEPEEDVSIKGTFGFGISTSAKVYVSFAYQYIEFISKQTIDLKLELSFKQFSYSFSLGEYGVSPVPGLYISVEPELVFEGTISITLNAIIRNQVGFSLSNSEGVKNLCKSPQVETQFNFEGKVFIGLRATGRLHVLGALAEGGFSVEVGPEVSAALESNNSSDFEHDCNLCIKGEFGCKFEMSVYAKFLNLDSLKFGKDLVSTSWKIADMYYSLDYNEFDFTTCPHIRYKVKVLVRDTNGNLIKNALINNFKRTDVKGTAIIYLPKGKNEVSVSNDGSVSSKIVEVFDEPISIVVVIPAKQESSEENHDYEPVLTGEIVQIAAGGNSSAAVTKDGDLYMWGANGAGQLGIQSNASKNVSTLVNDSSSTLPEKSVKYVSLGDNHSAAITKDGSLYMWGYNRNGQLGDGTTIDSYMPKKIMENVVMVSLGSSHSAAITKDGSLYMWGYNGWGELGDGTTSEKHVPKKIMENVVTVNLGGSHSAAITKDGSLYTWGDNCWGELGNGSANYSTKPQKIMENVVTVSLGGSHSAAVTKDGSLYTWGYNCYGQLGDGTNSYKTKPQKIATNVSKVELGNYHSIAISKDGGLYAWGDNAEGQFGNGTQNSSLVPVKIMSNVVGSIAGYNHTLILKKDGTLYTCGQNGFGQLGDETYTNKLSPVKISIYDRIPVLHSIKEPLVSVGASSTQRTAKFTGYSANGIYNFYSVKNKNADKLLTDDNILYVDQVRADANGNINVTYNAKADCVSPYEFVASITQIDIGNAEVTAESLTYNGKMQTVEPVVKVNGYTLYNGIDYKLTGAYEAKDVGEYTYTIIGQGDFVGYITKTFTINPADVNNCDTSSISAKAYTGTEIQPDVELTMDNDTLKKDVDYTVEYQNNVNAGIGIVVIKGMGNYSGRKVCWFDITKCDISKINITIPICAYYGKAVIPEMFIENNGVALVKDKDYTVTFKNNDSVGTATAVITGIGNYSGTVEKRFQIREPFGDVDMNGKIDVNDVTIIMAYNVELMNLSSEQLKFADVNEDGYVDVSDATLIQQYIADCI